MSEFIDGRMQIMEGREILPKVGFVDQLLITNYFGYD